MAEGHIDEVLGDLIKLTKHEIKNQYLRGLVFQLYENNGVIKRTMSINCKINTC